MVFAFTDFKQKAYFPVSRIKGNLCENSSFEKIRTIPINLIQLHYFADVMNEFGLID